MASLDLIHDALVLKEVPIIPVTCIIFLIMHMCILQKYVA